MHQSRVSPGDKESSDAVQVSLLETLSVFDFSCLRRPGVKRVLCVTLAAIVNACLYLEGLVILPMSLRPPVALNGHTTLMIISAIFYMYCGFVNTLHLRFGRSGKLHKFLKDIDEVVECAAAWPILATAMSVRLARFRRVFRRLFVVFFMTAAGNSVVCTVLVLMTPDEPPFKFCVRLATFGTFNMNEPLPALNKAPWGLVVWQVVMSIFWIYESFMWIIGFFIFFSLGQCLAHLLSAFNTGLKNQARESSGLSGDCVAAYRLFYMKLIEFVGRLDSMFRLYVGITFAFTLTAVMFILNAVLDTSSMTILTVLLLIVWFISGILLLSMAVYISGRIFNLTKKSLDLLHGQEITSNNFNEMIVLIHAVSNNDCGITCASFFVVDYSLVVSLAGLFMTYFVLIVQTKETTAAPSICLCNTSFNST